MRFDKQLIDLARSYYDTVYVDKDTGGEYIGSKTSYTGDRVRIYATDFYYETPDTIHSNNELYEYIASDESFKWYSDFIDDLLNRPSRYNAILKSYLESKH